jgi:hypothetical protein
MSIKKQQIYCPQTLLISNKHDFLQIIENKRPNMPIRTTFISHFFILNAIVVEKRALKWKIVLMLILAQL